MSPERKEQILDIANQLHTGSSKVITNSTGQQYLQFEDKMFMKPNEQTPGLLNSYAKDSRITIIIRTGKRWGLIIDQTILDPEDGA